MARLALSFLFLLAFAADAAARTIAELPYRIDYRGWYTVSGTINGKGPFDLIVDTGATRTLIFANTLAKAGGRRASGGEPISVLGLSRQGEFPTYIIDDIRVGDERLSGLMTVVLPDWNVDGRAPQAVLGLDFLSRYHVEFDAERQVMRLHDRAAPFTPPSRKWKTAGMSRDAVKVSDGVLYTADVQLNGQTIPFMLDLGSTGTIVNEIGAARGGNVGIQINRDTQTGASRITDALSVKTTARLVMFQRMRLGGLRWNRAILVVYDAPIFDDLGVQQRPFGLIGANLFQDRSFAFDFANLTLHLGPTITRAR